ncbi:hypothetical protein DFA_07455 [Cavenderia fasciculata]|uniref:Ankyrin repeat-containing protein n=1 Tax=Cavenderia fasciculata TaxID=261658 RepID=F4PWG7_CACFS|nr:uncharacterized protein DFA_07455 [Cavenderia fasciculata]EGG20331.1 hypothetical protein DFA_07455 [Cavenderia fasciculata]|eukprot:XP_004367314.1 hypothetical protein DFA_07455 [Cavenderia fasciculata]
MDIKKRSFSLILKNQYIFKLIKRDIREIHRQLYRDRDRNGECVDRSSERAIEMVCLKMTRLSDFTVVYNHQRPLFVSPKILYNACRGGSLDIVKMLLHQTEPIQLDRSLAYAGAIAGGHLSILQHLKTTDVQPPDFTEFHMWNEWLEDVQPTVGCRDAIRWVISNFNSNLEYTSNYRLLLVRVHDIIGLPKPANGGQDLPYEYLSYDPTLKYIYSTFQQSPSTQIDYFKFIFVPRDNNNNEMTTIDEFIQKTRLEIIHRHPNLNNRDNDQYEYLNQLIVKYLYKNYLKGGGTSQEDIISFELLDKSGDLDKVMDYAIDSLFGDAKRVILPVCNLAQIQWLADNEMESVEDELSSYTEVLFKRRDAEMTDILGWLRVHLPSFFDKHHFACHPTLLDAMSIDQIVQSIFLGAVENNCDQKKQMALEYTVESERIDLLQSILETLQTNDERIVELQTCSSQSTDGLEEKEMVELDRLEKTKWTSIGKHKIDKIEKGKSESYLVNVLDLFNEYLGYRDWEVFGTVAQDIRDGIGRCASVELYDRLASMNQEHSQIVQHHAIKYHQIKLIKHIIGGDKSFSDESNDPTNLLKQVCESGSVEVFDYFCQIYHASADTIRWDILLPVIIKHGHVSLLAHVLYDSKNNNSINNNNKRKKRLRTVSPRSLSLDQTFNSSQMATENPPSKTTRLVLGLKVKNILFSLDQREVLVNAHDQAAMLILKELKDRNRLNNSTERLLMMEQQNEHLNVLAEKERHRDQKKKDKIDSRSNSNSDNHQILKYLNKDNY